MEDLKELKDEIEILNGLVELKQLRIERLEKELKQTTNMLYNRVREIDDYDVEIDNLKEELKESKIIIKNLKSDIEQIWNSTIENEKNEENRKFNK
jgi:predicted RNase H-like nuclease (RuvC/YqgF family)